MIQIPAVALVLFMGGHVTLGPGVRVAPDNYFGCGSEKQHVEWAFPKEREIVILCAEGAPESGL